MESSEFSEPKTKSRALTNQKNNFKISTHDSLCKNDYCSLRLTKKFQQKSHFPSATLYQ